MTSDVEEKSSEIPTPKHKKRKIKEYFEFF